MMRLTNNALALVALSVLSMAKAESGGIVQTFFVPLPDDSLLNDIFDKIHSGAESPVTDLISVAVSSDNTVIYYDHWEDGFESDVTSPTKSTTEVWGDGDASNGCAPGFSCSDANDVLSEGDVIILSNQVNVYSSGRNTNEIRYDGGDRLKATRPVAMTRAAYPSGPGSMMAGAVEVIEQDNWGTAFEAPVGQNVAGTGTNAYQFTALAVMAGEDNTKVTFSGTTYTLNAGKAKVLRVPYQGQKLTSDKPVQVDLITGDIGSTYELRWYSLAPTDQWSNEAYAPVGDTEGTVRVTVYNPNSKAITVKCQTPSGTETLTIYSKKSKHTEVIKNDQAMYVSSDDKFYAFSSTDTTSSGTSGQIYDWGYPLMTADQLTDQVLVGLGYGCTGNSCGSSDERSVVWVTPEQDAYIHVDFDGDKQQDTTPVLVRRLESKIMQDPDKDMSGALIWATTDPDPLSDSVKLAAAWGQKAAFSKSGDSLALDLGTVVVPFEPVRTSCSVSFQPGGDKNGDGIMNAGDLVVQKILVSNSGPKPIVGGTIAVETLVGPKNIDFTAAGEAIPIEVPYVIPPGEEISPDCKVDIVEPEPTESPTTSPTKAPTKNPTKAPTKAPTGSPVASPTDPPVAAPTDPPVAPPTDPPVTPPTDAPVSVRTAPTEPPTKASGSGDPHFKTWTGEKFDYHGECDLVLVDNPSFNDGLGLRVHIRTTRIKYFSFIEKVAVQLGKDVLEFDNDVENFYINGEPVGANRKHHKTLLSGFVVRRDSRALSIRLQDDGSAARKAGMIAKIDLHTRKNGFPAIIMDAGHTDVFKGSLGLLGEWKTGRTLARDGVTEIEIDRENAEVFALEWQVRDTDPNLFMESRYPQYPQVCTPPEKMLTTRLGMSKALEEAKEACAHWKEDVEDCIFDVIATRDVMVAEEGHIVNVE